MTLLSEHGVRDYSAADLCSDYKHGSFVVRVRIEHIDAGNGFHIGTGTWRFVRGTGAYVGMTGGSRVANAWLDLDRER